MAKEREIDDEKVERKVVASNLNQLLYLGKEEKGKREVRRK